MHKRSGPGLVVDEMEAAYPGFRLGPISLELRRGVAYGLLGPNAAGKTTLLNALALQKKLARGSFSWNGRVVPWGDSNWKRCCTYIRETPVFYEELTVRQTLRLAASLCGEWDAVFANRWVDRFRLDPAALVGSLSKGSLVKLGLIIGLAHRAEVLLLDEPTAGLDPTARMELQSLLREIVTDQQLCVVISSHLFDDLEAVAHEVLILRRGKVAMRDALAARARMQVYRSVEPIEVRDDSIVSKWKSDGFYWWLVRLPDGSLSATPGLQQRAEKLGTPSLKDLYIAMQAEE